MMHGGKVMAAVVAIAMTTTPVMARPVYALGIDADKASLSRQSAGGQVGLIFPIGGKGTEAKARAELSLFRRHHDVTRSKEISSTRLGWTLDRRPAMLLNGRAIPEQERRKGIGTWGYVGIGVVALLVCGVLLLDDALDDASD